MIDYDELDRLAEMFRRDDFDPDAFMLEHEIDPNDLVRFALEFVRTSTLFTNPTPTEIDAAAVFVSGVHLGLRTRARWRLP